MRLVIWIPIAIVVVALVVGSLMASVIGDRRSVDRRVEFEGHLGLLHRRARRGASRFSEAFEQREGEGPPGRAA